MQIKIHANMLKNQSSKYCSHQIHQMTVDQESDSLHGTFVFPVSGLTVVGGSGVCWDAETPGTPVELRGI